MLVWNKDADSSAYDLLRDTPRPGHADYAYQMKYGLRDHRGGGRASARETVGRVAAGAVAKKLCQAAGIEVVAYVAELGGIKAEIDSSDLKELQARAESNAVRCPDLAAAERMMQRLDAVRLEGDSLGGIVVIIAEGVPAGLGEPVFDKLDADLARALMSIGAVKAVEIGAGLQSAELRGSEMNDPILMQAGKIDFESNNAGGILGGISTGQAIVCRIAVKPTPSIARPQRTVDLAMPARPSRSRSKEGMTRPSRPELCPWPSPWSLWFWPITCCARGRQGSDFISFPGPRWPYA